MTTFHLFERVGIELEYMIVDAETLSVKPIADRLIHAAAGEYVNAVERGPVTWSNELVNHVIELKTTEPVSELAGLDTLFQNEIRTINRLLEPFDARLMPTG